MIYEGFSDDLKLELLDATEYKSASTKQITLEELYIGMNKESPLYKKLVGIINYNGEYYRFIYKLEVNNNGYMVDIAKIVKRKRMIGDIAVDHTEFKETDFGFRAFWDKTSLKYLKEIGDVDSVELRKFMNKFDRYVSNTELYTQYIKGGIY